MSEKINLTILVAPLDWGLGHATRCVPIITQLRQLGCKVIIAAEGVQEKLLKTEFPDLIFVHLEGYRISYSRNKRFFSLKIIAQLPKLARAIKRERQWLKLFVANTHVDAIVSDNRYGLYHSKVPSVFITHQLLIKVPFTWVERWLQKINYALINRFDTCWVPDEPGVINLAGELSHPEKFPTLPVQYLGVLSRLVPQGATKEELDLLVMISGPEPQRTVLEKKIADELVAYKGRWLLVRGLPGNEELYNTGSMPAKSHLPANELAEWMSKSKFIISRSGYTTVMDICRLNKKAILIPTPGQTEQEYLARHLEQQGWCIHIGQEDFSQEELLRRIREFEYKFPQIDMEGYKKVINYFVKNLRTGSSTVD